MTSVFKAGGALTDEYAAIYIEREADYQAVEHLRAMDYLLLIEPRQQGKTSLINHLRSQPALSFLYVYFTTPDRTSEQRWYKTIGQRLLHQLHTWPERDAIPLPEDSFDWRVFIERLAGRAQQNNQRIVIALDEIGAVPRDWSEAFFSVIRDVYNSRLAESEFRHITFVLAGAYNPRDLIRDNSISPFNIAHRVRLSDFTLAQVHHLVSKGWGAEEQVTALAKRIHYWTDGQPYLTQLLCSYLVEPTAKPMDVDTAVDRLRREDENHLPPLFKRFNNDIRLRQYVNKIQAGEQIKFFPGEDRRQAELELLGLLKVDNNGCCVIRNRIYELVLKDATTSPTKPKSLKPISQPKEDKRDPYAELKRNLNSGNVVAFVGAGLSIGAGLPSWYSLISELAKRICYKLAPAKWANSETLIEAAQAYINGDDGLNSLVRFLKEKLDTTRRSPTVAHRALARLPISLVFTANYDNLLERAYRDVGKPVHVIVTDKDISTKPNIPNLVTIVKLYGDLDQPDTIVLARQQYETFFPQRPQIINLLQAELGRSDVLYLGWSLTDPHFNLVFSELLNHFGQLLRPSYAVLFNLPRARRNELKRKHIRLVKLPDKGDRTEQIAAWLKSIMSDDTTDKITP